MNDWSNDLGAALASGDPAYMQAMLERVPGEVLERALPYIYQLGKTHEKNGELDQSLSYYSLLVRVMPDQPGWRADRARVCLALKHFEQACEDARHMVALAADNPVGWRLQALALEGMGELAGALAAMRQFLDRVPDDKAAREQADAWQIALQKQSLLRQAIDPGTEPLQIALPDPPKVVFDPALLVDPSMPPELEAFRIDGLRQHLLRYSGQFSARNALTRLQDPQWLDAWDSALADVQGARLVLCGSELGLLALRALHHGARHVGCVEAFAQDARIAGGVTHKHFLKEWHARHGARIADWSEDERRASFGQYAESIDIDTRFDQMAAADYLLFPNLDHTLLGTGIVKAVREYQARHGKVQVLPARARLFAMAIEWTGPDPQLDWQAMHQRRWNLYPQALPPGATDWRALSTPQILGSIDFAQFSPEVWQQDLTLTHSGTVNAILFWFELELGAVCLTNAPFASGRPTLHCIRPAVQYIDPLVRAAGESLPLRVQVLETRLLFHTTPPTVLPRSQMLPAWSLATAGRERACYPALKRVLAAHTGQQVLNIGAGFGVLAMMAAKAGAARVVACETHPAIGETARAVIAQNGLAHRVSLSSQDCRKLRVPDDLPQPADLALFDAFDGNLIGDGILHFLAHARAHLLSASARYLPASARIRAMVIEYRFDHVWHVDASLLNAYCATPGLTQVDASTLTWRALCEPFDVFGFDFANAEPQPQEMTLAPRSIASGVASAILFWFDLTLDEQDTLSNAPGSEPAPLWPQCLQFLPEVRVDTGTELPLMARHNGSALHFQWQTGQLDPASLSTIPRFDPRWLAANDELEQQTRSLLTHCAHHPDEFAKVAAIAQRFAIDPAAHGLDPVMAERFANMFFA